MQQPNTNHASALPYFPNLDGLRFISFLIVFFSHGIVGTTGVLRDYNYLAFTGLDFFFVLSAFLITHRLLSEEQLKGKISLSRFFYRRCLRVWPLYFLTVVAGFAISFFAPRMGIALEPLPPLWTFLTFTVNFWMVEYGTSFLFFLVFLWSICLEEQFYAVLGLLMRFAFKMLLPLAVILVLASLCFRFVYANEPLMLLYHSVSLSGSFGMGIITAWVSFHYGNQICRLFANHRGFWWGFYLLFLANLVLFPYLYQHYPVNLLDRPILWLFMSLVIVDQCVSPKSFLPMGHWTSFRYLGKISYGMYVFHGIIILMVMHWPMITETNVFYILIVRPICIFALTVLAAFISFQYFEKPFLALKSKLSL